MANIGLAQRFDPVQGSTAVHIAATYGHVEAVRLLLDAGADLG